MEVKQKVGVQPKDLRAELTEKLIADLAAGTAPWQKPWSPSTDMLPRNGITGNHYHGGNALNLMHAADKLGYNDPRWMTYKQAVAVGASVQKGSKSVSIEYWQFSEKVPAVLRDAKGRPIEGPNGKPIPKIIDGKQPMEEVKLDRPRVYHAAVFNASQIDGLKPIDVGDQKWDPAATGEAILAASGATIKHDQSDRAFYRPSADEIHLPPKSAFPDAARYYGTALHELGHWTGHAERLNREGVTGGHAFGTPEYAKEELRAELASYFLSARTGIPHDPGQHTAYVGSWIKALEGDKNEIFRAASDAEKMVDFVLDLQQQRELLVTKDPELVAAIEATKESEITKIRYSHDLGRDEYGYTLVGAENKTLVTESHLSRDALVARLGEANVDMIDQGDGITSDNGEMQRGALEAFADVDLANPALKTQAVEQAVGKRREVFAKARAAEKELLQDLDEDRDADLDVDKPVKDVAVNADKAVSALNKLSDRDAQMGTYTPDPTSRVTVERGMLTVENGDRVEQFGSAGALKKAAEELDLSAKDIKIAEAVQARQDLGKANDIAKARAAEKEIVVDPALAASARPGHTMNGPVSGTILAEGKDAVYQNLGRGNSASHEKQRLDQVPAVGDNVKIQYGRDGQAKVQQINQQRSKDVGRDLGR